MPGRGDPLFTGSYCPRGLWLLHGAHVMPRQPAHMLGASWRSERPQEMEKRFPGHPSESVRISRPLVSLGRIFLTLNGAIATKYTTDLHVAPGKKNTCSWSPPLWGMSHLQKVCSGLFLQRDSEPQNICNMAATKSATAIKARQRVKEGTIKGWQGR